MKKIVIAFATILMLGASSMNAQGLGDILKNAASSALQGAASSVTNNSTVSSIITGLLGTQTVDESSVVGTWQYESPAIVFESDNMLTKMGASAVSKTIETKLQNGLNKVGFTAGKATLDLKSDKTGTLTVAGKSFPFQWSVSGTDLTITLGSTLIQTAQKSFKMNVNIDGGKLQVAMKTDKLLTFLTSVCKNVNSSGLSSLTSLTKNVKGMSLGLKYSK